MNWDEKALEAGEGRFINGNEHIVTYDDQVREEVHVHVFSFGAKWQRDQLRTDEAVERVARSINPELWHMADKDNDSFTTATETSLATARKAITALLDTDTL